MIEDEFYNRVKNYVEKVTLTSFGSARIITWKRENETFSVWYQLQPFRVISYNYVSPTGRANFESYSSYTTYFLKTSRAEVYFTAKDLPVIFKYVSDAADFVSQVALYGFRAFKDEVIAIEESNLG